MSQFGLESIESKRGWRTCLKDALALKVPHPQVPRPCGPVLASREHPLRGLLEADAHHVLGHALVVDHGPGGVRAMDVKHADVLEIFEMVIGCVITRWVPCLT